MELNSDEAKIGTFLDAIAFFPQVAADLTVHSRPRTSHSKG
jgi:hypothetical protein